MGKYGSRHRKNRDQYKGQDNVRCWLCGELIDMSLPREDNMSYELDHVKPVSKFPELRYDPANTRPSHKGCNRDRGNRDPKPGLTRTSRDWSRPWTERKRLREQNEK